MRQTLSLFLLLCLLVGQACADERVTLSLADQKGNMRAQLEAAGALDDLTYDIRWFEFPPPPPRRSTQCRCGGCRHHRRRAIALRPGRRCPAEGHRRRQIRSLRYRRAGERGFAAALGQ